VIHTAMRIRLMRMDAGRNRIEWLSLRGWAEVMDTYQTLFPRSSLPRFCRFVFWDFIIFAAILLCAIILKTKQFPSLVGGFECVAGVKSLYHSSSRFALSQDDQSWPTCASMRWLSERSLHEAYPLFGWGHIGSGRGAVHAE
jgi:hypothetical protein